MPFPGHAAKVFNCQFSPHSRDIIASGSDDFTIRVWSISTKGSISLPAASVVPSEINTSVSVSCGSHEFCEGSAVALRDSLCAAVWGLGRLYQSVGQVEDPHSLLLLRLTPFHSVGTEAV